MPCRFSLGCFFAVFTVTATAQNLIQNPGFESTIGPDYDCNQNVDNWKPAFITPDYYSQLHFEKCIGWNNWRLTQPNSGNNYAGLYIHRTNVDADWPSGESMQQELQNPLIKNQHYYISLYLKFSGYNGLNCTIDRLLVNFASSSFNDFIYKKTSPIALYPENKSITYINDSTQWVLVSGYFTANGTEKHISIGNYQNLFNTKKLNPNDYSQARAYYFIDDVRLELVSTKKDSIKIISNRIFLDNVTFTKNSFALSPAAFKTLAPLIIYLKNNSSVKIEVSGHTDNTGIESSNLTLSYKRAKSIVDYLVQSGIPQERLSFKGNGSLLPLTSNQTEQGRAANRRVEFVIIK